MNSTSKSPHLIYIPRPEASMLRVTETRTLQVLESKVFVEKSWTSYQNFLTSFNLKSKTMDTQA